MRKGGRCEHSSCSQVDRIVPLGQFGDSVFPVG